VPKPRMTRSDKWNLRPPVARYRDWCDIANQIRPLNLLQTGPICLSAKIFIRMPESWSKKKREQMRGRLHTSKPDTANCIKAIEDALWPQSDSMICRYDLVEKRWEDQDGPRTELVVKEARDE